MAQDKMLDPLTSVTAAINAIFANERFFRIPNYQRPFSWDDEQFDELITDLINADKKQQYFLGTIVLHKEEDTLVVVDGQQRLTSLMILLACLRDLIEDETFRNDIQEKILQKERKIDGIPERVRLEVRDHDTFQVAVVSDKGTTSEVELSDFAEPERRYFAAAKIFHRELSELSQNELQDLASFISQKCVLIQLTAQSFEQAFRLFEVVNDRGKQLRRIDILKSSNISPTVITSAATRDRIAARWQDLENEIGEDHFEAVFFLLRLMLLKEKPQGDILKEFDDRVFSNPKIPVQKGQSFAALLFDCVDLYRSIFIDQDFVSPEIDEKISARFKSLIFIMNNEFRASEWKACLLSYASKFKREGFFEFLLQIEKLFLTHWVASVRKDERYADYTKLLFAIESAKTPAEVPTDIGIDTQSIVAAAKRSDFYSAGYCKYLLLRLELIASELDTFRHFEPRSVEHIFPQNPKADSEWSKLATDEELKDFVHQLGNLVLISKSKNSSAGNRPFDVKKKTYLEPRVTDFPRSIQILKYTEWNRKIIERRTEELAEGILSNF